MLVDDDAKLQLLARAVSLLRGARLRLGVSLAGAPLRARGEEHAISLLELRLEHLDLELQGDAVVALCGLLEAENRRLLARVMDLTLALEVDAHDEVVVLDTDPGLAIRARARERSVSSPAGGLAAAPKLPT